MVILFAFIEEAMENQHRQDRQILVELCNNNQVPPHPVCVDLHF